jgi:hypothetical protein
LGHTGHILQTPAGGNQGITTRPEQSRSYRRAKSGGRSFALSHRQVLLSLLFLERPDHLRLHV